MQRSIFRYLLDTGQMRISADATLEPLPGMVVRFTDSLSWEPEAHTNATMDQNWDEAGASENYTGALP